MLFAHIIISIFTVLHLLSSVATTLKRSSRINDNQLLLGGVLTTATLTSGAVLVLRGASLAHVCVEGGALVVGFAAFYAYNQTLSVAIVHGKK